MQFEIATVLGVETSCDETAVALYREHYAGFGPTLAALILLRKAGPAAVADFRRRLFDVRLVRPVWSLVALFVYPLSVFAAFALTGSQLDAQPAARLAIEPALLVVTLGFVLIFGPISEEPGWRGFALPRLQERYGALGASLGIGAVWAVWHYPLFLTGQARNLTGNFALYAVVVCALSVLLTWLYNATGGSVLLAMLFHANVNTGVLVPVRQSAFAANPALFDAVQTGVFVALALGVVALTRGRLGRDDAPTPETVGAPIAGRERATARRTGDPGD